MAVPGGRYPLGLLDQIDLPSIYRRIQRQHERAGFPLAFSAVDISLIEDSPRKSSLSGKLVFTATSRVVASCPEGTQGSDSGKEGNAV
jgi:hypothetical protein